MFAKQIVLINDLTAYCGLEMYQRLHKNVTCAHKKQLKQFCQNLVANNNKTVTYCQVLSKQTMESQYKKHTFKANIKSKIETFHS